MCGIAGMIGLPSDRNITDNMLASMKHRGPDGEGRYQSGDCCLLHVRLAIIDPDGGR